MIITMQQICKDFPLGEGSIRILHNINMRIERGEYVSIMGPSGSGKTTLMNLIGCLDVPTSGVYQLDGQDVTVCDDNRLADIRNRKIGFVFQSFHLLPKMTALENVALPLLYRNVRKKERMDLAMEALSMVGLEDRAAFSPDRMSGGQCQRTAIARAMVGMPKILLADEPTGALDSGSGAQIMQIFRELNEQGMTILMITHDRKIAQQADRILYLFDGELGSFVTKKDAEI